MFTSVFLPTFVQYFLQFLFLGAVAFGGIMAGSHVAKNKKA